MKLDPNDLLLALETGGGLNLETLLNDASEAVVFVDGDWIARYCNATFASNLGLAPNQIIGRTPFEYTPTDFKRSIFYDACYKCVVERQATSQVGFSTVLNRWLMIRAYPVRGGGLLLANDATDSVVKAYHLAQAAVRDELTGLGNKLALEQRVEEMATRMEPFTLALLGLRRFREINETHGYATGDLVLMELASRLQSATRGTEAVFRVSGDEFALVVNGPSPESTHERIRLLLTLLHPPVVIEGLRIPVSVGVGTVNSPVHGDAFGLLLKRAGLALGEAKRVASQALPVMPFRMDLELAAKHRLVLEQELRQCLDGSQFTLLLQPKVCLNTGAVVGAEALIRWVHPKRGILSPGAFLPLAREIGAMRTIDAWVLRQAISLCAQLRDFGATFPLSINLSADALGDVMLPERLIRDLATAGLPASMLEIEIPEGDLMADVQASVRTLEALANMGVRLSIDDFGTGYSSFAYLAQFPVHTLKIDRSFVIGLSGSGPSRKIVKGIVRLAHSLGLDVVAEGAEDENQLVQLQRLKCDAVQGFAVAPAMPLPQFRAFAASRPAVAGPDPFAI
ncbi:MAG: EAL domain-containing protein [Rubrivivax sp.]|jgi:diguanylate cyclase (GGDEF)-like protein|nr:EAL domain-containing protein [Rubrivivax sp.]